MFRPHLRRVGLIATYALLTAILTWPTITQLSTHVPGDGGDDPAIAWNLWWVKHALLTEGQNPFYSDHMFFPVGINLAFYTLTVLNGLTALPITLLGGVPLASNLHAGFTFVVGAYGLFLLTRLVLTDYVSSRYSRLPAAIAGGCYAFASSKLFYVALGQFNIASTHWIPFTILYLERTRRTPHAFKPALLTAFFLTLQTWAELTYASFLVIFIALYWIYWFIIELWRKRSIQLMIFQSRALLIIVIGFTLGVAPILTQMLPDMIAEGDFFVEGSGFAAEFSADLLGFIVPTMHHPVLGSLIEQTSVTQFRLGQHIYLGLALLLTAAFAIVATWRHAGTRFWVLATLVFGLLALGPIITSNGAQTDVPGPFVILQQLPFFRGNRYPSRYSVMLVLSLSVLLGLGLALAQARLKRISHRAVLLSLVAVVFLFEHLSLPLPQSDMRVPTIYEQVERHPDGVLLDVPFAWRNGFRITGALTTEFMFGQFYQSSHTQRLLHGNTSRNPAFKFQYFTQLPVLDTLLALETGKTVPTEQWDRDRDLAADVLRTLNIRQILVRPYSYSTYNGSESVPVSEAAVIPYVEDVLPVTKVATVDGAQLYRVDDALFDPDAAIKVEIGDPLAPLFAGEGWGHLSPDHPLSAQRRRVRLLLPLSPQAQQLTLKMRYPDLGENRPQSVRLSVNGWQSASTPLTAAWQDVIFNIPAHVARDGLNDVWLQFDHVISVAPPTPGTPLYDVTVISAGEEVGGFGEIYLNGHLRGTADRGYALVAFTPGTSRYRLGTFDTHLDASASEQLAQFVADEADQAMLAAVAIDEASLNLGEPAIQALQSIGATADLRGCFRCSHAFVTLNDQINEASSATSPVGVTTQYGLTEPHIAAQLQSITIAPMP